MKEQSRIDISSRAELKRLGFEAVEEKVSGGVVYRKRLRVWAMPYLSQQVDDEFIFEDSLVTVEITVAGDVQMRIEATHYSESPVPAESDEGQALLRDAVAAREGDRELRGWNRPVMEDGASQMVL